MNITARNFTTTSEMKAAAVAVHRRCFSPAARAKAPERLEAPKIAPLVAREQPIPQIGWMMQPTTFDAHVVAYVAILELIRSGAIEVNGVSRRSVSQIVKDCLLDFPEFTIADMKGHRRGKQLCLARHHAVYAVREERPDLSYPAIGRWFGGRDHSTILNSVSKIKKLNGEIMKKM